MRILGVDPGLQLTGYGLIEIDKQFHKNENIDLLEMGILKTQTKDGIGPRLKQIFNPLLEIVDEFRPDVIVIEKLFAHYKHPTTAILMGHARGAVCLVSAIKDIKLINLPSTHVKKAVTGAGHAGKHQVQSMVAHYLKLKTIPDSVDASDALAIAIAYAFSLKTSRGIL